MLCYDSLVGMCMGHEINAFSLRLGVTTAIMIAGSKGSKNSNDERGLIFKLNTALHTHKFTIKQLHNVAQFVFIRLWHRTCTT